MDTTPTDSCKEISSVLGDSLNTQYCSLFHDAVADWPRTGHVAHGQTVHIDCKK